MVKFIAWRIAQLPLILAAIYLITFLLVWVAPGSPFMPGGERKLDPTVEKMLKEQFHSQSLGAFLRYYPARALRGDLGPSMYYNGWSVTTCCVIRCRCRWRWDCSRW